MCSSDLIALSRYIKAMYPESVVLGIDRPGDFADAAKSPVFYCRIVTMDKANGHNMNTVAWMDCRIAVHLLCPNKATNLKMISAVTHQLSVDERIILLDGSPMDITGVQLDKRADYLKTGQLYITGRFGILKHQKKPHAIIKNVIKN